MGYEAYKLVDQDGYSRRRLEGETLWLPIGTTVRPSGEGTKPCGPGVLHGYVSPEVAILANPIHADIEQPRLLRIESDKPWETDGLKRWTTGACQVLAEVDLPVLTTEEIVAWVIVLAPHKITREWAVRWLTDRDRSAKAADRATRAAWAEAAEEEWAAARAAWAAARAAWAAAWAPTLVKEKAAEAAAETAENEQRLMPALARARAILAGKYPADKYDGPLDEEVDLPVLTTEEVVAWIIVLAPHVSTRGWAIRWLSDNDRSVEAAEAAAEVAEAAAESWTSWAAEAAARAAEAASWAAAESAEAAARAADGAAWAAETAEAAAREWAANALAWAAETTAENEQRLVPALARARSILAGKYPADKYDEPFDEEAS